MKSVFTIIMFILTSCSAGPSEKAVQTAIAGTQEFEDKLATAIELTEQAKPTETMTPSLPTPTNTPEPTSTNPPSATSSPSPQSAFKSTFSELGEYLTFEGFSSGITSDCLLPKTPVWVQCDNFIYSYKNELSQFVQVLHDGETVVGAIIVFTDLGIKYPDEQTLILGVSDFRFDQEIPVTLFHSGSGPARYGDYIYNQMEVEEYSLYIFLDIELGKIIYE